jgi:small subunit ribosomal protein S13
MAQILIAGVVLDSRKRVLYSLQSVRGIGRTTAQKLCALADVDAEKRTQQLTSSEVKRLNDGIKQMQLVIEGDLRQEHALNIQMLKQLNSYVGKRHRLGLTVHGQSTHSNAKTGKKRVSERFREE